MCSMVRVVSHGRPVVNPVSSSSWKGSFGGAPAEGRHVACGFFGRGVRPT
jgi:hypothetical protein